MIVSIRTNSNRQVIDITERVEQELKGDGIVYLLVRHTTAAITTADLDPGTDQDLLDAIELMTPQTKWHHPHDPQHFPDHLWASLIGCSLSLPFSGGKLALGTWQRLVLLEFDGPRKRELYLGVIA